MQSITGSKICQCVFHTGTPGVESKRPLSGLFCMQMFGQSLNQAGGGNVKYAKNLHNMSGYLLNLDF